MGDVDACPWCHVLNGHMRGCPLTNGALPARVTTTRAFRPTAARIMPLDDQGRPAGNSVPIRCDAVTVTTTVGVGPPPIPGDIIDAWRWASGWTADT